MNRFCQLFLILFCVTYSAAAQAQQLLGTYKDWVLMEHKNTEDGDLCYIGSKPFDSRGTFGKRSDPLILVTSRSQYVDEVSVTSGYRYAQDQAGVSIDGRNFSMFTEEETAWAPTSKQDTQMIAAMKKGSQLILLGTSQKDTKSEDVFSLKGFSEAYNAMKVRCTN
jgi:hypothetical protein